MARRQSELELLTQKFDSAHTVKKSHVETTTDQGANAPDNSKSELKGDTKSEAAMKVGTKFAMAVIPVPWPITQRRIEQNTFSLRCGVLKM
jgi:hypothetical protein